MDAAPVCPIPGAVRDEAPCERSGRGVENWRTGLTRVAREAVVVVNEPRMVRGVVCDQRQGDIRLPEDDEGRPWLADRRARESPAAPRISVEREVHGPRALQDADRPIHRGRGEWTRGGPVYRGGRDGRPRE